MRVWGTLPGLPSQGLSQAVGTCFFEGAMPESKTASSTGVRVTSVCMCDSDPRPDAVDDPDRRKYARHPSSVAPMLGDRVRATTLKLVCRGRGRARMSLRRDHLGVVL